MKIFSLKINENNLNRTDPQYTVLRDSISYILTIKNYACIGDPHGIHGNTGVVSIVFF